MLLSSEVTKRCSLRWQPYAHVFVTCFLALSLKRTKSDMGVSLAAGDNRNKVKVETNIRGVNVFMRTACNS